MSIVGVIGTGSFGQKRIQALQHLPKYVKNIVIFDQDPQTLSRVASLFATENVTTAPSIEAIFSNPDIHSVFICTPNHLHADLTQQALQAGKHVLCEKPIAKEAAVINKLIRLAKKQKRTLVTGTNHRYFPSVQKAIELVKAGQLGKIYSFHANIGTNGQRIQDTWFWRQTLAGGGTFCDNGHHLLDLALVFCGPFDSCLGHSSTRHWQGSEVEDYAVAIYSAKQSANHPGYEAVLRSSWRQPDGYLEIDVWGSNGWLRISVGSKETLEWQTSAERHFEDFSDNPKESLQLEIQQFFDHTYPQANLYFDHLSHLTKMIEAFYTSQLNGQRVMLQP